MEQDRGKGARHFHIIISGTLSINSHKVRDFVEAGAKEALTPSDVIAESDITFSCVSDPQVLGIWDSTINGFLTRNHYKNFKFVFHAGC